MSAPAKLSLVPNGDPSAGATYPAVDASKIAYLNVFPPVGIARFGDSEKEYFYTPDVPTNTKPPTGITSFRDSDQRIRRQAVRFRVYAYDAQHTLLGEVNGKVKSKVNGTGTYKLEWTTQVANSKGAYYVIGGGSLRNQHLQKDLPPDERNLLIIDSGKQSITQSSGPEFVDLKGKFHKSATEATVVHLGQLQFDDAGRLIFVAGTGKAMSVETPGAPQPELKSPSDNDYWFDTACDGWVRVRVTAEQFNKDSEHAATIVCGPPNIAWGINAHCSLYDVMENIYYPDGGDKYDFTRDIWPVLMSASLISWTSKMSDKEHGSDTELHFTRKDVFTKLPDSVFRRRIFDSLRDPTLSGRKNMPKLAGDATVTKLQYKRLAKWKDGSFALPIPFPPQLKSKIEDIASQDQPEHLTRASAETIIGSTFNPGIEVFGIAGEDKTYDRTVKVVPPFRVNHTVVKPGHLTQGLYLPWQSDFWICGENSIWWPSVRPTDVATNENRPRRRRAWTRKLKNYVPAGETPTSGPYHANTQMARYWYYLGILREVGNKAVWVERDRSRKLDNPRRDGETALVGDEDSDFEPESDSEQ